jgi:hypothetical protein
LSITGEAKTREIERSQEHEKTRQIERPQEYEESRLTRDQR